MVSKRCKMVVKAELDKLGLHYGTIELGEAEIMEEMDAAQSNQLKMALLQSGLQLMDDKKAILIEKIKSVIVELVHYHEEPLAIKNSDYISAKLHYDYTYLANHFSETTGITIEHFLIMHKIERVKELLLYNELSLTEIAFRLNYSSVAHLSSQFKKVTGLTPSFFKKLRAKRIHLEDV